MNFQKKLSELSFLSLLILGCTEAVAQAPDYSELRRWAAHPAKRDNSDSIPSMVKDRRTDTLADVFFIHPTTYSAMLSSKLNADPDSREINKSVDEKVLLNQASAFNKVSRVYAPRYRQANLKVFFMKEDSLAKGALDLAYTDVKRAFEHYLRFENKGRPIIIAGHSQGAAHATRLLKEFFDGKALEEQLVCAYVIGFAVPRTSFTSLPEGCSADQTGCVVGWRTFRYGTTDNWAKENARGSICTNPVTWKCDTVTSRLSDYEGGLSRGFADEVDGLVAKVDAADAILWVSAQALNKGLAKRADNLHVADINLFYFNIRNNVEVRVKAFYRNRK